LRYLSNIQTISYFIVLKDVNKKGELHEQVLKAIISKKKKRIAAAIEEDVATALLILTSKPE
jgi:hypothetical protein